MKTSARIFAIWMLILSQICASSIGIYISKSFWWNAFISFIGCMFFAVQCINTIANKKEWNE